MDEPNDTSKPTEREILLAILSALSSLKARVDQLGEMVIAGNQRTVEMFALGQDRIAPLSKAFQALARGDPSLLDPPPPPSPPLN